MCLFPEGDFPLSEHRHVSPTSAGTRTHKLKCVSLGEVFWWARKEWWNVRGNRVKRGSDAHLGLGIAGWGWRQGQRRCVPKTRSRHRLWNFKLSLTRTTKRGTLTLWEVLTNLPRMPIDKAGMGILRKTDSESRSEGQRDRLPGALRALVGVLIDSSD